MNPGDTSLGGAAKDFAKTAWGMVERARDSSDQVRRDGLNDLCRRYWKPVYHFLRVGYSKSNEDAKDLTQAFFLWFSGGEALRRYEPERASFRTYLKTLLRHFVLNQQEALGRLKRGGGVDILALEDPEAPLGRLLEDPRATDPEVAFHRAWRGALIVRAVGRVRELLRSEGKELKFRIFEAYDLAPAGEQPTYQALGERFGLPGSEVQHYLVDVREAVRGEIRRELAETAESPQDLEEEWNAFFGS